MNDEALHAREVAKLSPQPGDIIIVTCPSGESHEAQDRFLRYLREYIPETIGICFVSDGVKIELLRPVIVSAEELKERLREHGDAFLPDLPAI